MSTCKVADKVLKIFVFFLFVFFSLSCAHLFGCVVRCRGQLFKGLDYFCGIKWWIIEGRGF